MRKICVYATIFLMGCALAPPRVADFNGETVKIRVACGMAYDCVKPRPEDQAEANKICATKGKAARFTSSLPAAATYLGNGVAVENYEHLYLCV